MIKGETDVGNQSLGLHQAGNDGIHTKILFIIYGWRGMVLPSVVRASKNSFSFKCLDLSSLQQISLN